jgi:nitrite reductase/ring-hydroxylating ferredoxin subunit
MTETTARRLDLLRAQLLDPYGCEGEIIGCGCHGWEFDIRTGQSWCEPERLRVWAYQVSVGPSADQPAEADPDSPIPGRVKGPYVAETYPVSVDGQYVVVEVAT